MSSKRPLGHAKVNDQIQCKRAKIIEACLKEKPIFELTNIVHNINQKKALFEAINSQDMKMVQDLLKIKVDVNIRDKNGFTPLHLAAERGNLTIVE